ncbi:hypothetical protein [Halogeometricum borinquense]|uniref:hypothetical protein n=1 Tax=Halogeometricum borinquense TaxID=60847 RepID=UPI00343E8F41
MEHSDVHVQRMPRWNNLPDRDTVASPLVALKEMGLSDELLAELEQTVDDDKYDEFFEDLWRIGDSPKDLGGDQGDVGEVLSSHPEKNLVESFVKDFDERDELVVVPAHDNMAKGFHVYTEENPEIDKLIMDKEKGEVVKAVEEKTGSSNDDHAREAIKQAENKIADIQNSGIPQDENGVPKIENPDRLNKSVLDLSGDDFANTEACAIVPRGMDNTGEHEDIDSDQVETYRWTNEELELMYRVAKSVSPW